MLTDYTNVYSMHWAHLQSKRFGCYHTVIFNSRNWSVCQRICQCQSKPSKEKVKWYSKNSTRSFCFQTYFCSSLTPTCTSFFFFFFAAVKSSSIFLYALHGGTIMCNNSTNQADSACMLFEITLSSLLHCRLKTSLVLVWICNRTAGIVYWDIELSLLLSTSASFLLFSVL